MIDCNWKTEAADVTHYRLRTSRYTGGFRANGRCSNDFTPTYLALRQRRDKNGPYTEMYHILRPDIDATCLRTSKYIYNLGIEILYGDNEFFFEPPNCYNHFAPPTLLMPGKTSHQPAPVYKPPFTNEEDLIPAFDAIERQIEYTKLEGWMYYDQFIRFLHTIGPDNARRIKFLRLEGVVKLHGGGVPGSDYGYCEHATCGKEGCDETLLNALKFWISFIRRFCTNLEKLTLHVLTDTVYVNGAANGYFRAITKGPSNREEAFTPLLEKLKSIESIKELEILGDSLYDEDMEFVDETVKWVAERAANRKRDAREASALARAHEKESAAIAAMVRVENLHCAFCGEGHVWAECWNLCSFCGDHMHGRKDCKERILAGEPRE